MKTKLANDYSHLLAHAFPALRIPQGQTQGDLYMEDLFKNYQICVDDIPQSAMQIKRLLLERDNCDFYVVFISSVRREML